MDSRRISAALGFTLLIACVIGIVILMHNSGSSPRSLGQNRMDENFVSWNGKDGFVNDPNYHSSQPTMQEVNDLADELHRLLAKKPKAPSKPSPPVSSPSPGDGVGLRKIKNGTTDLNKSFRSTATSSPSNEPPIAINFGIVSNGKKVGSHAAERGGSLASNYSSVAPAHAVHLPVSTSQQINKSHHKQGVSLEEQFHGDPHPGHQSPGEIGRNEPTSSFSSAGSNGKERGGAQNDLYRTSWQPSMNSPGMLPSSNHHFHQQQPHSFYNSHPGHRHHQQPHHIEKMNEEDVDHGAKVNTKPLSVSYGLVDKLASDDKESLKRMGNKEMDTYSQHASSSVLNEQTAHRWHEADFVDDGISSEEDGGNDGVDHDDDDPDNNHADHQQRLHTSSFHEDEEVGEDEDDEQDPDDEDPEPKNFATELETLLDLANHLYTSGANGSAFQGFVRVVNETIQRGNNSKLLVELNEMYEKSDIGKMVLARNNASGTTHDLANMGTGTPKSTLGALHSNLLKARTPYETSLTAFVFMSFGVFLLNQIHSFVQKSSLTPENFNGTTLHSVFGGDTNSISSRAFETSDWWPWPTTTHEQVEIDDNFLTLPKEPSSLDILFEPPQRKNDHYTLGFTNVQGANTTTPSNLATENGNVTINSTSGANQSLMTRQSRDGESKLFTQQTLSQKNSSSSQPEEVVQVGSYPTMSPVFNEQQNKTGEDDHLARSRSHQDNSSSDHVNNMFRALLNIVNAYTKNSQALECIWSLYCQDLDKTAGKKGLYGVAARINSVGLRLIMNQIPASLTMDVILRSLVGWDGLPCQKMFPPCIVDNGTISMVKDSSNMFNLNKSD